MAINQVQKYGIQTDDKTLTVKNDDEDARFQFSSSDTKEWSMAEQLELNKSNQSINHPAVVIHVNNE